MVGKVITERLPGIAVGAAGTSPRSLCRRNAPQLQSNPASNPCQVVCEIVRGYKEWIRHPINLATCHQSLIFIFSHAPLSNVVDVMAEPIGIASGLVALTTVAFKSSISLFKTIQNFQNHPRRVRDLLDELQALSGVLRLLTATVSATADIDFSALELPLRRCDDACKEFEQEIIKCSSRSGGTRTSFKDWSKLTYMGDDIDGFKLLLAGYKSTINIALADANL